MDIYYAEHDEGFYGLVPAKNGEMWFFEKNPRRIARATSQGVVTEFQIPYHDINPEATQLIVGPDGDIWFQYESEGDVPKSWLVRMTMSGVFSRVPDRDGVGLVNVPGGQPWTENGDPYGPDYNSIGILQDSGTIRRVAGDVSGLLGCAGQDGSAWVALGDVRRVTRTGDVTMYKAILHDTEQVSGCAVGSDGSAWWVANQPPEVLRLTIGGRATRFPLKRQRGAAFDGDVVNITAGPDKAMWVAADNPESLARITPSGATTEYSLPIKSQGEISIAAGASNTLWLLGSDFIAVLHLDGAGK